MYLSRVKLNSDSLNAMEPKASPNSWYNKLRHISDKMLNTFVKKVLIKVAKGIVLNFVVIIACLKKNINSHLIPLPREDQRC